MNIKILHFSILVLGDARSVYVGNLSSSITAYDLEQEFKNFGRIRPAGVTVRSRKVTVVTALWLF